MKNAHPDYEVSVLRWFLRSNFTQKVYLTYLNTNWQRFWLVRRALCFECIDRIGVL